MHAWTGQRGLILRSAGFMFRADLSC